MTKQHYGKLYLIPTTLGDVNPLNVLPITVKNCIENLNEFIVENNKTARRFIKTILPQKSQPDLVLHTLNKRTQPEEIPSFLNSCLEGKSIGLLSEAGVPGVADPGASVTKIAHELGVQVVPLVGPSSILLALMASGLNGQNFAFNGYLPIDQKERKKELKRLEHISKEQNQSQLFIETPYRNNKMLIDLCSTLHPHTLMCIACDLTLPSEYIKTLTITEWKKQTIDLHKRPAIFIIHQN